MAELIASGTTEQASGEFILADGQSARLSLKPSSPTVSGLPGNANASVQGKTSDNGWLTVGILTGNEPSKILPGPGTFRVVRHITNGSTVSFGVDKD